MAEENELERLEEFVSTLLQKFNDLQGQNKEMAERLQRRDVTIETLQDDLASMKNERGDISSRVSTLIGKIEEWETTVEPSVGVASSADSDEESTDSGVQGNLFTPDTESA